MNSNQEAGTLDGAKNQGLVTRPVFLAAMGR